MEFFFFLILYSDICEAPITQFSCKGVFMFVQSSFGSYRCVLYSSRWVVCLNKLTGSSLGEKNIPSYQRTKYIVHLKNLVNQFKPNELLLRQFCSGKRLVRLNCSWFRLTCRGSWLCLSESRAGTNIVTLSFSFRRPNSIWRTKKKKNRLCESYISVDESQRWRNALSAGVLMLAVTSNHFSRSLASFVMQAWNRGDIKSFPKWQNAVWFVPEGGETGKRKKKHCRRHILQYLWLN